jgi:hypothetical protein
LVACHAFFFNLNTVTWSGPRWVVVGTGQAPCEPAGPLCAIEPAESPDGKKTSAEEKDYDPGLGRVASCHTSTHLP